MSVTAEFVREQIEVVEGLPHPKWISISQVFKRDMPSDQWSASWREVVLQWLGLLNEALGSRYRVTTIGEFILFSGEKLAEPGSFVAFVDSTFKRLVGMLPAVPEPPVYGPRLVVLLDSPEEYYSYITRYSSDGRTIASDGAFVGVGYRHIVMNGVTPSLHPHLAHELCHLRQSDFSAPLWLEEGLAQYLPQVLLNVNRFHIDPELVARHKAFWAKEGLEPFWRGLSFGWVKTGSRLSYHLSEVLVRNIATDHPAALRSFMQQAKRQDAGAAASRACFGRSLGHVAAGFLGGDPSVWEPRSVQTFPGSNKNQLAS